MAETAADLMANLLPQVPVRQFGGVASPQI